MDITTKLTMPRGPVMADVAGFELTDSERKRLCHPAVGGVILFRRNYQSRAQLMRLVADIKSLRQPELVVAVDHEGGRVQRFIDGFTRLPAMRVLGEIWDSEGEDRAKTLAQQAGWVLAAELRACGIDLSFTPVLDLDWGKCAVIGNRSFHRRAEVVSALALALQHGLHRGGMKACGKHFPGHGCVAGDSHLTLPEDGRSWDALWQDDIQPFRSLIDAGMAAVMPAHVLYPQVDAHHPAGYSAIWLKDILRERLGFNGVIFSDDLTMEGAGMAGNIVARAQQSFAAGCDIVLVCNKPDWVDELLSADVCAPAPLLAERWQMIAGQGRAEDFAAVLEQAEFQAAQAAVSQLASPKDTQGGVKVGEAF